MKSIGWDIEKTHRDSLTAMLQFPAALTTLDKLDPVFVLPTSFYKKTATHSLRHTHTPKRRSTCTHAYKSNHANGSLTSVHTHTNLDPRAFKRKHTQTCAWLQQWNKTSSKSQQSRNIRLIELINIITFWIRTQWTPLWTAVAPQHQLFSISFCQDAMYIYRHDIPTPSVHWLNLGAAQFYFASPLK